MSIYRADRTMMLSDMALRRGEELLPNYKVLDAYTGVYDASKAADTIAEANRVYTLCRNEYYRLKGLVDDASTVAGIDDVVSGADFGSIV